MDAVEVVNVTREGIRVLLIISAPIMLTALIVGLAVSFVQALTQIQEMTLTFVPKIVAMLIVMMLSLPYMLQYLDDYTQSLFLRISNLE